MIEGREEKRTGVGLAVHGDGSRGRRSQQDREVSTGSLPSIKPPSSSDISLD